MDVVHNLTGCRVDSVHILRKVKLIQNYINYYQMVPRAGIEPARPLRRGIFLPTIAFATANIDICGLDFLFAMLQKSTV